MNATSRTTFKNVAARALALLTGAVVEHHAETAKIPAEPSASEAPVSVEP